MEDDSGSSSRPRGSRILSHIIIMGLVRDKAMRLASHQQNQGLLLDPSSLSRVSSNKEPYYHLTFWLTTRSGCRGLRCGALELNGLDAGEIKRRPEVEMLLVARGNHTEGMKKVSNWPTEGVD